MPCPLWPGHWGEYLWNWGLQMRAGPTAKQPDSCQHGWVNLGQTKRNDEKWTENWWRMEMIWNQAHLSPFCTSCAVFLRENGPNYLPLDLCWPAAMQLLTRSWRHRGSLLSPLTDREGGRYRGAEWRACLSISHRQTIGREGSPSSSRPVATQHIPNSLRKCANLNYPFF